MTQNTLENIVIVALIVVGVGLGIYFRTQGDSQLAAVLLALALAAILYKFLGGNQETNRLSIGVLKFGGSAAVLGGFIWLLSQVIFTDKFEVPADEAVVSFLPADGWYAARTATGAPLSLEVLINDTIVRTIARPDALTLSERSFKLAPSGNERFPLVAYAGSDTLGFVLRDNIPIESDGSTPVEIPADISVNELYSFRLYPHQNRNRSSADFERKFRQSPFPFPFIVRSFGASFVVEDRDGRTTYISEREVVRKIPYLIEADGKRFLLFASHANFILDDLKEHYSEWVVIPFD